MKNILLSFLILLGFPAISQTPVIFENNKTQAFVLSHEKNTNSPSQKIVNEMLKVISSASNKPVFQSRIYVNLDEHILLTRSNHKIEINIAYEKIFISGDNSYKGFEMNNALKPGNISLECILKDRFGSNIKKFTLVDEPFNRKNREFRFEYPDTIPGMNYSLEVVSRDFSYTSKSRERFEERCQMIDRYYYSEGEVAFIYNSLRTINTQDFKQINLAQKQLDETASRLNIVESDPMIPELDIPQYDPIKLLPKIQEVKMKMSDIQNQIQYVISNLHVLYTESGKDLLNSGRRPEARNDFRQALNLNPLYPHPYYFLAMMAYLENNNSEAMRILSDFFRLPNIDNEIYARASQLYSGVESRKLKEIKNLIIQQKQQNALNGLDELSAFCKNIRNFHCNDSIFLLRAEAYYSTYKNFLIQAQSYYAQGKFDEAQNSVDQALLYQRNNSNFISSNEESIELQNKINKDQYPVLIKQGKAAMNSKDYTTAFNRFYRARIIETQTPVKVDPQLPELVKQSKLQLLFEDANLAQSMVAANNLANARQILLQIIDEQSSYGLADNSQLTKTIDNLKQSIFSKQCMNVQSEYDQNMKSAYDYAKNKNFIAANEYFKIALQTAEKNRDCQINAESAQKGLDYTQNPAEYQRKMEQINAWIYNSSFENATAEYEALTDFYKNNNLSGYQIDHVSLPVFISRSNNQYIHWGADYMAKKNDFNSAFFLLDQLKQKAYDPNLTRSLQKQVAIVYALNDYKANPGLNPKVKVLDYTKGDNWFSCFARHYRKQYKKLSKS